MNSISNVKLGVPSSRQLVYTSAGDKANLHDWLRGKRKFDLWVTYYGNQGSRYKDAADFYNVHQGSKWQNLYNVYLKWPEILNQYEAILVMDDDILINTTSINRLFGIRKQYDLWICQAAFDVQGKISHDITAANPEYFMRYVNFIENTCPLFKKDKLDEFMKVYDGTLMGNGVDFWYLNVLGPDSKEKFAIIDAIRCINPLDQKKGGVREYAKLDKQTWRQLSTQLESKYGIKSHLSPMKEFGSIPKMLISDHLSAFYYKISLFMQRLIRYLMK